MAVTAARTARVATAAEGRNGGRWRRRERARPDGPPPPSLDIAELEARTQESLVELATEQGVENPHTYNKQDLLFRILRQQAERQGTIYAGGVLAIVDDGFGFLRGERLVPGPNDVYVSQSQIRRFALRGGDYVTGQVRQPKDSEKYYGLPPRRGRQRRRPRGCEAPPELRGTDADLPGRHAGAGDDQHGG